MSQSRSTIKIPYRLLYALLEVVSDYGISKKQLLTGSNLSPIQLDNDQTIDKREYDRLCSYAIDLTGDTSLGIQLGCRLSINSLGVLGQALMSSSDVRQAFGFLQKYYHIVAPSAKLKLTEKDGRCSLYYEVTETLENSPHFFVEAFFASLQVSSRFLLNNFFPNAVQTFSFKKPVHGDLFDSLFHIPVFYEGSTNALVFDSSALDMKVSTASPAAVELFREQCETLLNSSGFRTSYMDRVKSKLFQCNETYPTIEEMAGSLFTSERTLRRRLTDEGTRYKDLLDDVRSQRSIDLLLTTDLPIHEIGKRIGFDDVANFRRTFKRWKNSTPAEFRCKH